MSNLITGNVNEVNDERVEPPAFLPSTGKSKNEQPEDIKVPKLILGGIKRKDPINYREFMKKISSGFVNFT